MTARTLVLAFYAEGMTDERFLPTIIRRTAEDLLAARGRTSVEVLDPFVIDHGIKRRFHTQEDRILAAARAAAGYHALLVHADADHATRDRALNERYLPGFRRVQASPQGACSTLVPLIPIHMVEAWMLADMDALRDVIGTTADAQQLGLPPTIHQIEDNPDPKALLHQVIRNASAGQTRRRRVKASEVVEPLAQRVRLDRLGTLAAYQQFRGDLLQALIAERLAE